MSVEVTLLLLRLASAVCLLALMVAIFRIVWRAYRSATPQHETKWSNHGRIVAVSQNGDAYSATGITYPLKSPTQLGRASTNHIVVADSFASNEHAQIIFQNGQWWLEDRSSRNGTTLNGIRIQQPVVVTAGDIIGIGQNFFRLESE